MSTSSPAIRTRIETTIALARLLQRVEASATGVDPAQYRLLVDQLKAALGEELPAQALDAILGAFPAAADIYENLHYAHAGLTRAPLERAVAAELQATQAIDRARRSSAR